MGSDGDSGSDAVAFVEDVLSTIGVVVAIGLVLFAVAGVWPPMVAVASGSMAPHLQTDDLVLVTDEHRFTGDGVHGHTGVVTHRSGERTGYDTFHQPGNVIVYQRNGNSAKTPIIHRARFWVNESENWYDKADPSYLAGAGNCVQLEYCPAPHAGFVTKGDANMAYDQTDPPGGQAISAPVKPNWVIGTAHFRVPWLGGIRLGVG